jgi:hypothetical protein
MYSVDLGSQRVVDFQQLWQFPFFISVLASIIMLLAFWPPAQASVDLTTDGQG